MPKEKVLALITASKATREALCSQLSSLLDGYMRVEGYATEEGIDGVVKADLIVLSSRLMALEASDYYDKDDLVVVANRSLNLEHLDKLFHIPKGTEVLVVNDEIEYAEEVVNLLRDIGLDFLRYVPYAPGCPLNSDARIAVTPGEVALVPKHIETVIDIKARSIDLSTIIEILSVLGLLDEKSHFVSAKFMETIVRLNKQLHDLIDEAGRTNLHLIKVLNQVNDGIIAYADSGTISVFNQKSELLLGTRSSNAIGRTILQAIGDKALRDLLLAPEDVTDQLVRINGADAIVSKFHIDKLQSSVCTLKNAKDSLDIEKKLRSGLVKKGYIGKYTFEDIIGSSALMRHAVDTAARLAAVEHTVLISGESGVGKELFASAMHNASPRKDGPFLAINFSELPEDLAESELFGYEDGAFTGARKGGRIGLFEQANGGTIFLDEIGDISPRIQVRLLRVLEEKEIRRCRLMTL